MDDHVGRDPLPHQLSERVDEPDRAERRRCAEWDEKRLAPLGAQLVHHAFRGGGPLGARRDVLDARAEELVEERVGGRALGRSAVEDQHALEPERSGRGVDVVLDMVAGDYLPKNLQLLKQDGRCVVIALQGGATATVSAGIIMVNRLTLTGSTLRARSVAVKAALAKRLHERVWPLLASGQARPVIFQIFPARDAAKAHALMESSEHIGKIMLTWPSS